MKRFLILLSVLLTFQAVSLAQTAGQKDTLVRLSFGTVKSYNQTTGNAITISSTELEKHTYSDFRDRLTGMIPGLEVIEHGGSVITPTQGGFTSYNAGGTSNSFVINGFKAMNLMIDDIPIPFNQLLLDPNQVESVTIVADVVDKMKAGPMAAQGAMLLRTPRGNYNTPLKVTLKAETGMNFADRIPGWVSGADYARLNNASRTAAGLEALYTDEAIAAFGAYKENDIQYPCVNYREKMLKDAFQMTSFGITATAGSPTIKYYFTLNGLNYGDLYNAEKADYNKINITSNVSTKIGNYIEASAGFMGLLGFRRIPNVSWYTWRSVPEVAYPLILGKVVASEDTDADISNMVGSTVYGVSKTFTGNYYAKMIEGGRQTIRNRSGMFHANVDVDFSWFLPGLKSKTAVLATSFISTEIGKSNDYIAYYWDDLAGIQEISDHKGMKQASRSMADNTTSSTLSFYERLYYDWTKGGHLVNLGANYYQSTSAQTGDSYNQRMQYLQGDAAWSYKSRYNLEAAIQYAGSSRFKDKARWGFFPSAGASWIVSNENFLKGNPVITKLKLHAQIGDMPTASLFGTPYLYQGIYSSTNGMDFGPSKNSGMQWFGFDSHVSKSTTLSRLANPNLTWERVFQIGTGIDIGLFDCLTLSADWFRWGYHGTISDVLANTPDVFGLTATIYDNYQANQAEGFNVAAEFRKEWGDFYVDAWAWASMSDRVYTKLVTDNYLFDYQKKLGTSLYAIWGYECLGKYSSQDEIDNSPSYGSTTSLQVGDLKYKDQNDDGIIDSNDQLVIGNSDPKLRYTLNLSLGWKNFDFQIIGTGQVGQDIDLTYSTYFTGADGMSNQSQYVLEHLGKELPRLSYYGVPNNELTSTWWLRKTSWFKIQSVDLGYTIPLREGNRLGLSSIRLDLMGSNLLTLTGLEYIDPEDTAAGLSKYPFYKVLTFGAKLIF